MAIALLLLVACYLAIVALVVFLIAYRPAYWWVWSIAGGGLAVALATRYRGGSEAILRSLGAELEPTENDHDVHAIVGALG